MYFPIPLLYERYTKHIRCRKHLRVNKKEQDIKDVFSIIMDHINDTGYSASIDDFGIIDNASNELDLLIPGRLLIFRDRPMLNQ